MRIFHAALGLGLATMATPVLAQAPANIEAMKADAFAVVDGNADRMGRLSDAIYSYAEIGFQEVKTIALVTKTLRDAGFAVTTGVAGMPTAYMATYGSGGPVIGLMSDFDGVPATSQMPTTFEHSDQVPGAPGHGEGHNTHQPTLIGAALAAKAVKDKYKIAGTIVVYGGPAEELLASRGYMVKAGLFKNVDAMLDLHVGTEFGTSYGLNNFANISVEWSFKGEQAHGARPWQGRSALDGVELMNVGVNQMREHGYDPADARIHYVISNGGKQPNVVPAEASVWYYFRAKSPEIVEHLLDWSRGIAQGAAMATKTEVSERIFSGSWPFNGNKALAVLVSGNIAKVGMPKWTDADVSFAKSYQKAMGAPIVGLPTEVEKLGNDRQGASTSDAGDISWNLPYVRMYIPAKPAGALAGHHWSSAIGPATPVAHKGIAVGSKALAASIIDLMTDAKALADIRSDWTAEMARWPKWRSLIPDSSTPPIHLNTEEMATYRTALKQFEYDPNSKKTYLEFMGAAYPPKEPSTDIGRRSNLLKPEQPNSSIDWDWTKQ
ncbi:amidohydrolase [Sphingorhabdus sp.]|jgi:aminobenzoyl-glutamate utilization protein B|uniref:amidohydrolase n=1 Tax=Sphingorhabdus sp. TaxID=1902408 RepID=UPI0037CACA72